MIIGIWKYRRFILQNAIRDLWFRYAGSAMGFMWNVINPLFQITLYTVVFSKIMQIRIPGLPAGYGFAIYLCAGLVPWISFNETVIRCTNSFVENASYLKKLAIPEQIFVVQNAASIFFSLLLSMSLLVGICFFLGHKPAWSWLALPFILLMLLGFGFGIGLFFGVLNVFFRDIGQAVGLFMQLWFWSVPIVYTENILPEKLADLLYLNPAYYFINILHIVIIDRAWPNLKDWIDMTGLAISMPLLGYLALRRLRQEIRDVL